MDASAPDQLENATLRSVVDFTLRQSPAAIPAPTMRMAALLLLDTLGVCIAATPMEAGRLARETAIRLYNTVEPAAAARLLFDGRRASRAGAVFAAASQIDNLDAHDGYNPTKGHIGVAAVPALVALAEARPALTAAEALATLVIGYEVAGRAGIALHATVSDYHTSGAWNALGVAAMAARLQGLTPDMLRQALGIAEYHGPRSQMMREIANPTMLHDGSGQGGLVGISAAEMAAMGFTGAPAITVEAPEAAPYWADLATLWQTDLQYIKPYPICRWAHAPIDAARELCLANPIAPGQIERVEIRSFHNAVQLFPGLPSSTSEAQYSLPFAVATMIVHGTIGVEHISGDGLKDPQVAALVQRTDLIEEARHEARYPEARWADVTLKMRDGRVLQSGDTHARGGPERPFSEADILDKYRALATPVLGTERTEAILDAALRLTDAPERPFAELTQHLFAAP